MSIGTQTTPMTSSVESTAALSTFSPLAFPPNSADILYQSVESQRVAVVAFALRDSENQEAVRQRKARRQLLRTQIERRQEMELVDQQASEVTLQLLDHLAVVIHERQTTLRPEGYQTLVFDNEDMYEGNWKSCRMHGSGYLKRVMANDLYEGEWFLGLRNGTGTCHSPDFGTIYSGKWQDGKWHGRGELVEPEGIYVGDFLDGRLQGYGEYVYNDGHVYKGDWLNGMYEGTGTYILPSGGKYEGQWANGSEHGRGTMTYFNGDTYTGDWRHGLRHGMGTYTSPFLQYEGGWRHGAVYGCGQCKYANGSTYDGEWLNGMYHGEGKFVDPVQRQSYFGEFRNGKRCGHGVYRSVGVEYTGEWLDDKKHGVGEMKTRGSGSFYGTWRDDKPHGEITYTANGEKMYTVYESGKCIRVSPQGPFQQVNVRLLSAEDIPA
ncbi:hypothetical protein DQ04_02811030 [Trypanosoma grayi]|uniref:hypothetical protein n=1 Tax=Trypanosoma grayi TaxID=71804 RepID=UPI0004F4A0F4|nr:hypothetical protein DQ04_02811030 [Trypanosoma grayi]KEG11250.1 hypothetical protein DQ04_02811030 [Trypanosoma grayi]